MRGRGAVSRGRRMPSPTPIVGFGVAVTRFYCVLSRESSSQAIPYLSTKIRSRTANIDTAPSRHIWPIIGPPSSVWESGCISRQARQGSTPAGECCTSVHTTPKRRVGRSGPSAQRAHRLTVRAGGGTDLGVVWPIGMRAFVQRAPAIRGCIQACHWSARGRC